MSPGQHQTKAFSVLNVAGLSSFNIMWHYAKDAGRIQRVTNIMSAPVG
ncbi:putative membrane protein [Pectobacterium atrosepticum SCRI1043]|uniref:Membrane protein n=1 Tax=Pectobacterium atrosepticum (strain SCRI 1043 / ATCC BAA-672) TaxID=218491 RepID=Q6D1P7_PECAS|nr:putative membrane protein [Pectobacterium atrosepticum SCRI1043]